MISIRIKQLCLETNRSIYKNNPTSKQQAKRNTEELLERLLEPGEVGAPFGGWRGDVLPASIVSATDDDWASRVA